MTEYIDREALRKILENWRDAHADVDDEKGCGLLEDVIWEVDAQTTVTAVPADALRTLRDDLYENDLISMDGLRQLNAMIARYEGGGADG